MLGVQEMGTKILQAALALHEKVASTFRKTAVNFHYEFTVRHLANVFQGLLMSTPEQFNNVTKLSRLWLHESERVYADRLVSAAVSSRVHMRWLHSSLMLLQVSHLQPMPNSLHVDNCCLIHA